MSEAVIENTNDNEEIDKRNAGLAFYTKDYSSSVPPSRAMLALVENKETERLILFDHVVNNCDRHNGNLIIDLSKAAKLYIIDNSHIIKEGISSNIEWELTDEAIFSKRILEKNKDIYDLLCNTVGYDEEKLLLEAQKIKEAITQEILIEIKSSIPEEWIISIGKETLDQIFKVLDKRLKNICKLSQMIKEERGER